MTNIFTVDDILANLSPEERELHKQLIDSSLKTEQSLDVISEENHSTDVRFEKAEKNIAETSRLISAEMSKIHYGLANAKEYQLRTSNFLDSIKKGVEIMSVREYDLILNMFKYIQSNN